MFLKNSQNGGIWYPVICWWPRTSGKKRILKNACSKSSWEMKAIANIKKNSQNGGIWYPAICWWPRTSGKKKIFLKCVFKIELGKLACDKTKNHTRRISKSEKSSELFICLFGGGNKFRWRLRRFVCAHACGTSASRWVREQKKTRIR